MLRSLLLLAVLATVTQAARRSINSPGIYVDGQSRKAGYPDKPNYKQGPEDTLMPPVEGNTGQFGGFPGQESGSSAGKQIWTAAGQTIDSETGQDSGLLGELEKETEKKCKSPPCFDTSDMIDAYDEFQNCTGETIDYKDNSTDKFPIVSLAKARDMRDFMENCHRKLWSLDKLFDKFFNKTKTAPDTIAEGDLEHWNSVVDDIQPIIVKFRADIETLEQFMSSGGNIKYLGHTTTKPPRISRYHKPTPANTSSEETSTQEGYVEPTTKKVFFGSPWYAYRVGEGNFHKGHGKKKGLSERKGKIRTQHGPKVPVPVWPGQPDPSENGVHPPGFNSEDPKYKEGEKSQVQPSSQTSEGGRNSASLTNGGSESKGQLGGRNGPQGPGGRSGGAPAGNGGSQGTQNTSVGDGQAGSDYDPEPLASVSGPQSPGSSQSGHSAGGQAAHSSSSQASSHISPGSNNEESPSSLSPPDQSYDDITSNQNTETIGQEVTNPEPYKKIRFRHRHRKIRFRQHRN